MVYLPQGPGGVSARRYWNRYGTQRQPTGSSTARTHRPVLWLSDFPSPSDSTWQLRHTQQNSASDPILYILRSDHRKMYIRGDYEGR